ncbi:hypothetical protein XSR1_80012 [Xenorhabdus szentirmaii DSM 16338]|uniref:Uncharacterized protein n=1 Tax=Xenorhabdus szentirmaii DSM 16338 TaxID=1427518 RepID=W1J6M8_9GAMM|nr:hypothetical protein XSR1_80012 [Xenorhabdus szentirmaii DSM 16338]
MCLTLFLSPITRNAGNNNVFVYSPTLSLELQFNYAIRLCFKG